MRSATFLHIFAFILLPGVPTGCARPDPTRIALPPPVVSEQRSGPGEHQEGRADPEPVPETRLPRKLDLAQAVSIALERNPDLLAATERMQQAEELIREARAAFFPTLSADFSALYADAPSTYLFKTVDQREFQPGTDLNDPGRLTNYELGLTLRYDLFRGGEDAAALDIAHKDRELAHLGRSAVRNELVAAVTNTIHDIISADELAAAESAAVETVRAQLSEAQSRLDAGTVLKDEVLSLEVRLAETEDRLIASRNGGRLARAALASLLAMDMAQVGGIQCEDVPPPGVPETYEAGIELARRRNPAFQSARRRLGRARLEVKKAAAGYYPTIGLFGRYYLDDERARFDADDGNWILGADIVWPIFSGFRTSARKAAAEAEKRRTEAGLERAGLRLERRVQSAYIRLAGARSRRKVAEAAVARAAETLELVSRRYQGGAVNITRYLEAEQDRTFARVAAIRSRCNERRALADVARALGWWTSERKEEP